MSNFFHNNCNIMDCTYKGVGGEGGWVERVGGWVEEASGWRGRVGSQRQVIPSNWTVWSSYRMAQNLDSGKY